MNKVRFYLYGQPQVLAAIKKLAVDRAVKGKPASISQVAGEILEQALQKEAERSADGLLGHRLERVIRSEVRLQVTAMRRLLARTAIEANATRRLLVMLMEDSKGQAYAREASSAAWLAAVDSLKKSSKELEAALKVMTEGSDPPSGVGTTQPPIEGGQNR